VASVPRGTLNAVHRRLAYVSVACEAHALQALVPARFTVRALGRPVLAFRELCEIGWLAGHGHTMPSVRVPMCLDAADGPIDNGCQPVMGRA
jgi:hypothetical protein